MDVRRVSARLSRRAGQAYISCVTHLRLPSERRCDARYARIVSSGGRIQQSPHCRGTPSEAEYEAPKEADRSRCGSRVRAGWSTSLTSQAPQSCVRCPLPAIRHLGPDHWREWVVLEHHPSPFAVSAFCFTLRATSHSGPRRLLVPRAINARAGRIAYASTNASDAHVATPLVKHRCTDGTDDTDDYPGNQ